MNTTMSAALMGGGGGGGFPGSVGNVLPIRDALDEEMGRQVVGGAAPAAAAAAAPPAAGGRRGRRNEMTTTEASKLRMNVIIEEIDAREEELERKRAEKLEEEARLLRRGDTLDRFVRKFNPAPPIRFAPLGTSSILPKSRGGIYGYL